LQLRSGEVGFEDSEVAFALDESGGGAFPAMRADVHARRRSAKRWPAFWRGVSSAWVEGTLEIEIGELELDLVGAP
jgi:hypothetical protein